MLNAASAVNLRSSTTVRSLTPSAKFHSKSFLARPVFSSFHRGITFYRFIRLTSPSAFGGLDIGLHVYNIGINKVKLALIFSDLNILAMKARGALDRGA